GAHHFHAETRHVVARGLRHDHFDGTAGESEHERPDRGPPAPVIQAVERCNGYGILDILWDVVLGQTKFFIVHGCSPRTSLDRLRTGCRRSQATDHPRIPVVPTSICKSAADSPSQG